MSFSCIVFQRACHAGCAFPRPSVFHGVQACRHLFLKAFKAAVCPSPNASAGLAKATHAAAGPSHLFFMAFKPAVCPPPNASAGLAKATLPSTGPSHLFLRGSSLPFARPQMLPQALPRQLSQLQAPAICF